MKHPSIRKKLKRAKNIILKILMILGEKKKQCKKESLLRNQTPPQSNTKILLPVDGQ